MATSVVQSHIVEDQPLDFPEVPNPSAEIKRTNSIILANYF